MTLYLYKRGNGNEGDYPRAVVHLSESENPYAALRALVVNDYIIGIRSHYGVLWRFETPRYTVAFWAEDEDSPPEDSFCEERDIAFASDGDPAHWFCAFVGVFRNDSGKCVGYDVLGGCSYNSFEEFYSAHRWQYSRRQRRWITDPRTRAWKACKARRRRRPDGSRMDGSYFPQMVRAALAEARSDESRRTMTA